MSYITDILKERKLIIGLRGGHSANCKGAVGLRDEYKTMQTFYVYVKNVLESYGHTVIDCNSNAGTEWGEVSEGFNKANKYKVDIFISLHMNSFDGKAFGVESLVAKGSRVLDVAERLCNNFATLGFYNRGVKNGNQWEMQYLDMPNIIFETCFCDSEKDINIWSPAPYEKLARLVANAIDPSISIEDQSFYRVCVQRFKTKEEAEEGAKKIREKTGFYCFTEKI